MRRKSTVGQREGEKLHGKVEKSKANWKSERPNKGDFSSPNYRRETNI